jgi:hypothetical protein
LKKQQDLFPLFYKPKIITIIVTWLAVLMVLFSGVIKLIGGQEVTKTLALAGVADKIGFILLSCYFAGALGTELSHGIHFNALTPMILIWIAAFLRDKFIFLPKTESTIK